MFCYQTWRGSGSDQLEYLVVGGGGSGGSENSQSTAVAADVLAVSLLGPSLTLLTYQQTGRFNINNSVAVLRLRLVVVVVDLQPQQQKWIKCHYFQQSHQQVAVVVDLQAVAHATKQVNGGPGGGSFDETTTTGGGGDDYAPVGAPQNDTGGGKTSGVYLV